MRSPPDPRKILCSNSTVSGTPKRFKPAAKDLNSGDNTFYLAPGLRFSKDNWSSFVSVAFPTFNDLNGIQSEPDIRVVTGCLSPSRHQRNGVTQIDHAGSSRNELRPPNGNSSLGPMARHRSQSARKVTR